MINVRRFFTALCLGGLLIFGAAGPAYAVEWHEDFKKVVDSAKETDKPMLLYFTGSDWCPPCKVLDQEVLSQDVFKEFADDQLVLMKLDFDRFVRPKSEAFGAQHTSLKRALQIRGFPMIVLLAPDGEYLETTGFRREGAEDYVKHLKKLLDMDGGKS